MKKLLVAALCTVFAVGCTCAFAGCGNDYSNEIEDLQKQIQALENKNNSLQTELNALKNSNYTAEINSLKQQITSLQTQVNSLKTSNTTLTNSLNAAKLRLDAVEGAMQADKNYTYQMGEVCTVKSASGIELYKVRLIKYDLISGSTDRYCLSFNLQRLNIPNYIPLSSFVNFSAYFEGIQEYSYMRLGLTGGEDNYTDFDKIYQITFSENNTIPTSILVGMPSDNDLKESGAQEYLIPFAIYTL